MGDNNAVELSNKWLEDIAKGHSHELETLSVGGLKIVSSHKGFVRCSFVVTDRISDADGNWHVGAMATLIDDVGAAAIYSLIGSVRASLDFSISFFSTAKIQEEVELEAKVLGNIERISSVLIEVRRKSNGELIALGKQWMAAHNNVRRARSKL